MARFLTLVALIGSSLAFAWLIVALISQFSPLQLTPSNYSYIVSPPINGVTVPPPRVPAVALDYIGFVSILLSLISALLAALGLGIAVLAVIGWSSITGKVETTANEVISVSIAGGQINEVVRASLREGGPLYEVVRNEARTAMFQGVESVPTFDSAKGEREE